MQRFLLRIFFLVSVVCLVAGSVQAQRGYHVDPHIGFKLRLPPKWKRWPVEKDRRFVTGFYVASQPLSVKGSSQGHRPTLRIVVLPKGHEAKPPEAAGKVDPNTTPKAEPKAEAKAASEPAPAQVEFYADYQDYLARNLSGHLVYTSTQPSTVGDFACVQHQIRRRTENRIYRLTTWVFDFPGHTVAVEYFVLDAHAKKLARTFELSLKSLRRLPTDAGAAIPDPWRPPLWHRDPERWSKLTVLQRNAERTTYETAFLAAVRADVAPGFKLKATKHFLVVSNADARYTTAIIQAADSCVDWWGSRLAGVSDETGIKGVIRIFGEWGDYWIYRSRSKQRSHYVPGIREIVIFPGRRAPKELTGLEDLTEGIFHHLLADKDKDLYRNLPDWFRDGWISFLRLSRLQRGKISFEVSDFEKRIVREALRGDQQAPVQAVIQETAKQEDDDRGRRLRYHRGRVLRFLLDPMSTKGKAVPPGFPIEYFTAVKVAQAEFGVPPRNPGAGSVPGWTEAISKKAAEDREKKRTDLLKAVNRLVCDWKAEQWGEIETLYTKFNKNL